MVDTRSGLFGLSVLRRVVQVWNIVIVPVRILDQHMEDESVAALDQVENRGLASLGAAQVSFKEIRIVCNYPFFFLRSKLLAFLNVSFQFTVDIRSGLIGLSVVAHAMEEGKTVTVHAPVPFL